ncbi:hypothetical protein ACFYO7_31110 [Nocardia salmonicida]|uniref:hypothetical protein n=1 Tax=Nocardia salmonicida TaxID=53431 RepID=UPI00368DCFA6
MMQNLGSGAQLGASGPWGASGPSGASGPFGFTDPAGVGGGGSAGGGGLGSPIDDKLFPRAASPLTENVSRAAAAETAALSNAYPMGMGGYPMGGGMGGMGGGQGQQQQQERKRAAYLDGPEHLEEAVGDDPISVRPVIDR